MGKGNKSELFCILPGQICKFDSPSQSDFYFMLMKAVNLFFVLYTCNPDQTVIDVVEEIISSLIAAKVYRV